MNLQNSFVLPNSKNKTSSAAIITESKMDIIRKKTRELYNLVEETFGRLNDAENPELLVEEYRSICLSPAHISSKLKESFQTVESSIKILEKIEAKREIARLSKDLEEASNKIDNSFFGNYLVKTSIINLEYYKDKLAELEKEEKKIDNTDEDSEDNDTTEYDKVTEDYKLSEEVDGVSEEAVDVTEENDDVNEEVDDVTKEDYDFSQQVDDETKKYDDVTDQAEEETGEDGDVDDNTEVANNKKVKVSDEGNECITDGASNSSSSEKDDVVQVNNNVIDDSCVLENNDEQLDVSEHVNKSTNADDCDKTSSTLATDATKVDNEEFHENFCTPADIDVITQEVHSLVENDFKCEKKFVQYEQLTPVQKLIVNLDNSVLATKAKKLNQLVAHAPCKEYGGCLSSLEKYYMKNSLDVLEASAKWKTKFITESSEKLQRYYAETGDGDDVIINRE